MLTPAELYCPNEAALLSLDVENCGVTTELKPKLLYKDQFYEHKSITLLNLLPERGEDGSVKDQYSIYRRFKISMDIGGGTQTTNMYRIQVRQENTNQLIFDSGWSNILAW